MKAEDKEDTSYKQRCGELEQENEFLKYQIVALQHTIALLQSPQTAVVVKKNVPQPLPAHVPLPTAVPCVHRHRRAKPRPTRNRGLQTAQGRLLQQWAKLPLIRTRWHQTRSGRFLQPAKQFRCSHRHISRVCVEKANTFISKRNADVEREEWPFGRAPEANIAGFSEYIEEHAIAKSSRRLVRLGVDRVLWCLEHNFDEGAWFWK